MGSVNRNYPRSLKAKAVGMAAVDGPAAAADALGIPRTTVKTWMLRPEFEGLKEASRDALAEQFWVGIQVGVAEVTKGLLDPNAPLKDKAVALGIMFDKHALMTGGATNRSESRDLSNLPDSELVRVVRVLSGGEEGTPAPAAEPAA